jgi:hypothetical protein
MVGDGLNDTARAGGGACLDLAGLGAGRRAVASDIVLMGRAI